MFKNATALELLSPAPPLAVLERALESQPFVPTGATTPISYGWVPPRGQAHGALVEAVAGVWVFKLRTETRSVPAEAVNRLIDERAAAQQAQSGRPIRQRDRKELKEEVLLQLLPHAFPKQRDTLVLLYPRAQTVAADGSPAAQALMVIGSTTARAIDTVTKLLVDALGDLRGDDGRAQGFALVARHLATATSPAVAMGQWLLDGAVAAQAGEPAQRERAAALAIGRACLLADPDKESGSGSVTYSNHLLEIDNVLEHLRTGKACTQLALELPGAMRFVLDARLQLRKLTLDEDRAGEPSAAVAEGGVLGVDQMLAGEGSGRGARAAQPAGPTRSDHAGAGDGADDDFDGDVALFALNLARVLDALVAALDGSQAAPAPSLTSTASTAAPSTEGANADRAIA